MNANQEAHYRMFRNVISYSNENAAITENLPEYNVNLGRLKTIAKTIEGISEEQKTNIKGITKFKLQAKNSLMTLGADHARKLTSYAKLTNNPILLSKVNYTASDFKRFSDESLKDYAQIIYNCAEPIVTQLTNYDITTDSLDEFLGAIHNYNEVFVSPDLAETIKKQATKKLIRHFREGAGCVDNMAAAVEIVRLKEPIFYLGFKTAQKITVRGRVSLSLKGITVDIDGQPVAGIIFKATLNGVYVLTKKTSKKGGFYLKSLAAGTYSFTFKKAGLADQTLNVVVNDGEMTKLKVIMLNA